MRLDKFLKVSRIIKRRSIAKEIADQGRILINGQPVKLIELLKRRKRVKRKICMKLSMKLMRNPLTNYNVF